MVDKKALIAALRCSTQEGKYTCNVNRPYRTVEEVKGKFIPLADFKKDGKAYLVGCDCDRMAGDTADLLEAYGEKD